LLGLFFGKLTFGLFLISSIGVSPDLEQLIAAPTTRGPQAICFGALIRPAAFSAAPTRMLALTQRSSGIWQDLRPAPDIAGIGQRRAAFVCEGATPS